MGFREASRCEQRVANGAAGGAEGEGDSVMAWVGGGVGGREVEDGGVEGVAGALCDGVVEVCVGLGGEEKAGVGLEEETCGGALGGGDGGGGVVRGGIEVHDYGAEKRNNGGAGLVSGAVDMWVDTLAGEVAVDQDVIWGVG